MITKERAQALASYLNDDEIRAKKLLELDAEEALAEINADGNDFTLEEIVDFGIQLKNASEKIQNGELDEAMLNEVAGGLVIEGVAISCIALGFKIGTDLAKNYGW